jgi:hypothetical protein
LPGKIKKILGKTREYVVQLMRSHFEGMIDVLRQKKKKSKLQAVNGNKREINLKVEFVADMRNENS